jgi:dTDP-4-amino-4,6-dideoxygalactose transaminase
MPKAALNLEDTVLQAGNFPVAVQVANQCLSLPMSPYLKKSEQNEVIDVMKLS